LIVAKDELTEDSHVDIHRAAFQKLLVEAASEAGAEILVNTRIIDLDESGPSPVVIARDGRRFEADLIIGADGEHN
jgi:2-polyprenyl-6-methoxyphenol hydroxylase-like FAD-dependent oxidoreductase